MGHQRNNDMQGKSAQLTETCQSMILSTNKETRCFGSDDLFEQLGNTCVLGRLGRVSRRNSTEDRPSVALRLRSTKQDEQDRAACTEVGSMKRCRLYFSDREMRPTFVRNCNGHLQFKYG